MQASFGIASASQWHRSVFTLAIHALCRLHMQCLRAAFEPGLRFGIAEASQCLHAVLQASFGVAVASQWHRSFFTLAMQALLRHRSGTAASSRWQCRLRCGFAVASQWHHSVSTLAMRVSLQRRRGIAVSSRCKKQASLGIAVASQRPHAVYAGLASASIRHRSGIEESSRCK